jgi:hypothetical protein|tara:strand:- start:765 stop:911 length:147 start_codon:yes stop_codon:yes gene_type:complete
MIKYIKNFFKNLFTPKKQAIILEEVKPEHCDTHLRFKKSCKACQEIVA